MKFFILFFILISFSIVIYGNEVIVSKDYERNDPDLNIRCAAATFVNLWNSDDVLNAVSLGRSLSNTLTIMDKIAIVYGNEDKFIVNFLKNSGWVVVNAGNHYVEDLSFQGGEEENDNQKKLAQTAGEATLAKFFVYTLTEYDVIVYLDNNVIVAQNIDELCKINHAKIGGVSHTKYHTIGTMTLVPSKETYETVLQAVADENVDDPYDFFEYYYERQECPYFDPLLDNDGALPSQKCVRLPVRYNGDIVYQILSGWVDNQLDKPKIIHYSISEIKPWSWWSSILLPEYWVWATNYVAAVEDAQIMMGPGTIEWVMKMMFTFFLFYFMPKVKTFLAFKLFKFLYNGSIRSNVFKLIVFHFFNTLFILFSLYWSDFYAAHPIMNLILFILTLAGFIDYILFAHLVSSFANKIRITYILFMFSFFLIFFDQKLITTDFLPRLCIVLGWFVWVHAIYFTLLVVLTRNKNYEMEEKYPSSSPLPHLRANRPKSKNDADLSTLIPSMKDIATAFQNNLNQFEQHLSSPSSKNVIN